MIESWWGRDGGEMPCVTWLICIVQVNGILLLAVQKNKSLTSSLLQKISSWKGHQRFWFYKKIRFFYHREGFKSGFIFMKRPTRNSVNDLDDEIGVLIKKPVRSILRMVLKYSFLLIADKRKTHCWIGIDILIGS